MLKAAKHNGRAKKGDCMPSKARNAKVLLPWTAMLLVVWTVPGCGSKSGKLPTYMRPELLYLNDKPYGRLYVEVDSVEGVEVPDRLLDDLRVFLAKHCSKPDGIEIVRDKPIPVSEVKDVPMGPASVLYLDGPGPSSGVQPAYLHLFFYDTKTEFQHVLKNPHIPEFCPSAIRYNVNYGRSRQDQVAQFVLKHEAGHVLGLTRSTAHGDGAHCSNSRCLMNASPGWRSGFFGLILGIRIERELCADCRDDLELAKSENVDPELEFKGPFLIRRENGYSVASLPSRHILLPQSVEDRFEWRDVLARLKEGIRASDLRECAKNRTCLHFYAWRYADKDGSRQHMIDYTAMLAKAANDPCPFISREAAAALEKLKQEETE